MADRLAEDPRDTGDDTDVRPDRAAFPGTPRWVYLFGIIVLALLLILVVMLLAGGDHGPGRHQAPASIAAPGVQQ